MSPGDILNPDRSLTNRNRQKINAASVTRIDTIWMELKPNAASFLTKIPILPQKQAAIMISVKSSFLVSCIILFVILIYVIPQDNRFIKSRSVFVFNIFINYNKTAVEMSRPLKLL